MRGIGYAVYEGENKESERDIQGVDVVRQDFLSAYIIVPESSSRELI
jgi:hypothetical protein